MMELKEAQEVLRNAGREQLLSEVGDTIVSFSTKYGSVKAVLHKDFTWGWDEVV